MSQRTASRVAWSLWVLGMAVGVLTSILDTLNGHRDSAPALGELPGIAAMTVGALIVSRRPSNRIGWLFLWASLLLAFGGSGNLANQYSLYTFATRPGALPAGEWMAWLGLLTQIAGFFPLVTFLPLLFPDGRPPSPRWRPVVWATGFQLALFVVGAAFYPRLTSGPVELPNPVGIQLFADLSASVNIFSWILSAVLVVLCVASVFVRFRHSKGDERQQLKWFGFSALLIPFSALIGALGFIFNYDWFVNIPIWQLSVAGIPIAVGIAVLKYRLYDISILIRRTLIYAVLTVVLALVYLGCVVILQQLFPRTTGQGSDLAIIISTLTIAALFNPVRRRVQVAIDHRFYRRKYDTAQVLAAFGAAVRDEVDLRLLTDRLLTVVEETMQPASASLWLHSVDHGRRRTE